MSALRRKAETRRCPSCTRIVPLSHMQVHLGYGEYDDLEKCKSCACSSRVANARAQMAVHQGRRL